MKRSVTSPFSPVNPFSKSSPGLNLSDFLHRHHLLGLVTICIAFRSTDPAALPDDWSNGQDREVDLRSPVSNSFHRAERFHVYIVAEVDFAYYICIPLTTNIYDYHVFPSVRVCFSSYSLWRRRAARWLKLPEHFYIPDHEKRREKIERGKYEESVQTARQ
ncbi:hypothetical protein NPIL_344021 [Nephila pilipes]|uniref:Uncharacterized protein n=1 Tax=Nephila pilipes TaxID=299642 RepID=A0A8X6U2X2_NEPPI|nr:hypothetical protein NPIL_344021 [Nephila pilipes]